MRGAVPKAIQELVGHSTLSMTLRYMHLAPSALREAIGLLEFGQPVGSALSVASIDLRVAGRRGGGVVLWSHVTNTLSSHRMPQVAVGHRQREFATRVGIQVLELAAACLDCCRQCHESFALCGRRCHASRAGAPAHSGQFAPRRPGLKAVH